MASLLLMIREAAILDVGRRPQLGNNFLWDSSIAGPFNVAPRANFVVLINKTTNQSFRTQCFGVFKRRK